MSFNLSSVPGFDELVNNSVGSSNNNLLVNKMVCRSNNSEYKVIRYNKETLNADTVSTFGLCRSVIVNSANKVVGFAPPKSIPLDQFMEKYTNYETIIAEEFVEGTMINVFFDDTVGEWEISTRNTVGATSSFYKKPNAKSFRQMFMEAAEHCLLDINRLNKDLCYSFVLQHPENRIVVPFQSPQLYLVGACKIINDGGSIMVKWYHSHMFSGLSNYFGSETNVRYPQIFKFDHYEQLFDEISQFSYEIMGIVLYNIDSGERSKIRNPLYEKVRKLRGNQAKLQYQYLCLRKEGNVSEYLKYFPENKVEFSSYREQVHFFTNMLYNYYVSCYIQKTKPLAEYPTQYRTHMYTIHQHFINELRDKKQFITKNVVQNYVNNMHPSLLMHCLNYQAME